MEDAVWKFTLPVKDYPVVQMPFGSVPLFVAEQHGQLCLWARVVPSNSPEPYRFRVAGTGHPITPDVGDYIGSTLMADGHLVFHVFAVPA